MRVCVCVCVKEEVAVEQWSRIFENSRMDQGIHLFWCSKENTENERTKARVLTECEVVERAANLLQLQHKQSMISKGFKGLQRVSEVSI